MTAYGQSIPPRWYKDVTAKSMTKMGFAHVIHKALMQVGMIPIRQWNPFDLELPANAEYNPGTSNRSDLIWYYDYPTSETFLHNGIAYRPVLCMVVHTYNDGSATAPVNNNSGSFFRFEHGYRRADRLLRDDFTNYVRLHATTSNYGVGIVSSAMSVGSDLSYADSCGLGAYYQFSTWKVHAASADANRTAMLGVKNLHVILGKGGLTVQVGTGVGKTDSNDIFSFTVVFGGARIPGRARVPISDPNLNLINPTFMLPHRVATFTGGSTANYWADTLSYEDVVLTGQRPVSWALGVQHGLKVAYGTQAGYTTRPGAVRLEIFNLENSERALFPSVRSDTVNSPRSHPSGAAHILQPLVYTQSFLKTTSEYFQEQDFNVRNQIAPTWFDCWMAPKFRFGDRSAPYGEFVDPVTGTNWFLFRAEGVNHMFATEVEGITKYEMFNISLTFNLVDDDYFNLNAGFTFTAGNPQQAVASQTAGTALAQNWTPTAATDEATVIHNASTGAATLTWVVEPYTAATADTQFMLQLELRWFSATAQTANQNSLFIEYSDDDGTNWITLQTIFNTGTSVVPYNSYTQTAELPITPGSIDGKIRFRIRTVHTNATGGNRTAAIRNVHIKQYTRA